MYRLKYHVSEFFIENVFFVSFHFSPLQPDPTIESLSYAISTIILVDSCHRCSNRVICTNFLYSCNAFCHHLQKIELIACIEKLTYTTIGSNKKLQYAKDELLSQIINLDISFNGKGFFNINRQFLADVNLSSAYMRTHGAPHLLNFTKIKFPYFRWRPLVALTF